MDSPTFLDLFVNPDKQAAHFRWWTITVKNHDRLGPDEHHDAMIERSPANHGSGLSARQRHHVRQKWASA
jgi:hypothetical protein